MSGGDTAIPGIRIDICMSDLMLSDFCEVSWTLCAKTLNLSFLVPLTDTNPLETISIFFSSSFHYFLSYFLSPVSSTIIFFFPNHTQEEKASKNRNKNPLSQCSQHRFDPWSGKIPHTMWYGQKTNKKRDMLQFLNIFLFTFTWWEITATGIIKSGLHLELGRSYLEQSRFFIVLSWPGESVYCFLTCSLKDSIQIFFFLILFIHLFTFACAASLSLQGLFSSCNEQGLRSDRGVRASHCRGFSFFRTWPLGCVGFSSFGTRAQ